MRALQVMTLLAAFEGLTGWVFCMVFACCQVSNVCCVTDKSRTLIFSWVHCPAAGSFSQLSTTR
jgi:hypothetical protein